MFIVGGLGVLFAAAVFCAPPPASGRFDGLIAFHARRNGLDPRLVKAVIAVESEFYPRAVSKADARGLMQVLPATADSLGFSRLDLLDPEDNLPCGTAYLRHLFGRVAGPPRAEETVRRVLAAYHGGPRLLGGRGWPGATRAYVRRVLSYYRSPASAVGEAVYAGGSR